MRCIFCKTDSGHSVSVEHIIPESLGNADHVLPRGTVCDGCNGYFARKIEGPLLMAPVFRQLRFGMQIANKRGRVPVWTVDEGSRMPGYRLMGRFLAKVGLEVLAFKTLAVEGWNEEFVSMQQLDDLRRFARFNEGEDWPFTVRTLHPVDAKFVDRGERYQLLHEFDILYTQRLELFLVLSLFGVELVQNLGGRVLDGYRGWLKQNKYASPLCTNTRGARQDASVKDPQG